MIPHICVDSALLRIGRARSKVASPPRFTADPFPPPNSPRRTFSLSTPRRSLSSQPEQQRDRPTPCRDRFVYHLCLLNLSLKLPVRWRGDVTESSFDPRESIKGNDDRALSKFQIYAERQWRSSRTTAVNLPKEIMDGRFEDRADAHLLHR